MWGGGCWWEGGVGVISEGVISTGVIWEGMEDGCVKIVGVSERIGVRKRVSSRTHIDILHLF